jgi:hypothetical protein
MNESNGIADLPRSEPTLEERIKTHLKKVQADKRWKQGDADKSDRERMRRRALIAAALDAIFEHGFREAGPEGIEVEVSSEKDVWSDLAIARQDFQNDAKLLDNMEHATGCLRPVDKESIIPKSTIGAERELMIIWLAVIELWDKARDQKLLKNRSAIMVAAAEATAGSPDSYKTNRTNIKKGERFTSHEVNFYNDLIAMAKAGGASTEGENCSPFQTLLAAAKARSISRLPRKFSAENLKG